MTDFLLQNGSASVPKKQPFGGRKRKLDEDVSILVLKTPKTWENIYLECQLNPMFPDLLLLMSCFGTK